MDESKTTITASPKEKPTNAWFIIAIFLGIIGGIIGYALTKDDDQELANDLLHVGIITSFTIAIIIIIELLLYGSNLLTHLLK